MEEQYLTYAQSISAARIFLNTFGFVLENVKSVDEFSRIKIFDKNVSEVGNLYFDSGKVVINTLYNNGDKLEASYDIPKIFGIVDIESNGALFGSWNSKINYQVQRQNGLKITGEFLVDASVDSEFGIKCLVHPILNCEVPGKGKINLKILRDGSTFCLEIKSDESYEIIDVRPWDNWNGYIRHDLKKGKYDEEKHAYSYRWYAGVFSAGSNENKNKLHVFLNEEEYGKELSYRNEFPLKDGKDNTRECLLQKGKLMKEIDPSMYKKIKELRKILLVDDISLLDNLVSVCYDSYTDEALEALLGVERQKMKYQDGTDNLIKSYFGTGENSQFLSLEEQKRLLNKKK